ncbi:MAG TPA: hypothetical protein VHA05_03795 [Candidatus Saccharimonadales bacterium]|nr:hypothetical protein [Candidatus Saccharimonadales bacterium]
METFKETVYPAEWPGFPGETDGREQARADLRVVDESFREPAKPDWLTMTAAFKAEEARAFKEADESPIYDYEIEMQRPVQPLAKTAERVSWRQRAKRFMDKAGEALRDASITAFTTAQVKTEELKDYYGDAEFGKRRRRITGAVAGLLAVTTAAYLESKGVSSGSSHGHAAEAVSLKPRIDTASLNQAPNPAAASHHVVTLHSGQNPWTISEQHLREQGIPHPSTAQISAYDQRMASANPYVYRFGDDSAEHITAGTKLRLP